MLAIENVRVYGDPEAAARPRSTVLIDDGRIVRVEEDVRPPPGAEVMAGGGATLVAGFWNLHVHLTEPFWPAAVRAGADAVNERLEEMFSRRGFTSVVDLGSDPRVTLRVRDGLRTGLYRGPELRTAGVPIYPAGGLPYYVRDSVPFYVRWRLPRPANPRAAVRAVGRTLDRGCDLVKLFTGSYRARGEVVAMPEAIASAAVAAAHARGKLTFAHPSNLAGMQVAWASGVDVLAHAPDTTEGVDDALLGRLAADGRSMVPTLQMFASTISTQRSYLDPIYGIVRRFAAAGGELVFGTDVGFMSDHSTDGEFAGLAAAGIGWRAILRMLTTGPARRWGVGDRVGRVAPGMAADLCLLDGDPATDVAAFARVRATVRGGRCLWDGAPGGPTAGG